MSIFQTAGFRAMGTDVELLASPDLPAATVEDVRALFAEVEARFSRFDPSSELSRLNQSAGMPFHATPVFAHVLRRAMRWAFASDGMFDPTVLPAVHAAGYSTSIEDVQARVQRQTLAPPSPRYSDVRISGDGVIELPPGCALDLGGLVKGWTVDRAASCMAGHGNWVINAGGDLLARGHGPDGAGWLVGVEDPFLRGPDLAVLALSDCAIATSSTRRRRWLTQHGEAHHLIDPRTSLPSETDLASVTVLAGSVEEAEVTAKTLLLAGAGHARRLAEAHRIQAVVVDNSGIMAILGGLEGRLV